MIGLTGICQDGSKLDLDPGCQSFFDRVSVAKPFPFLTELIAT